MTNRAMQVTHVLLRMVAGFLFMFHGAQKLLGWYGGFRGVPGAKAELVSLMGLAGTLELIGGLAILIGLMTRPIAFLLSGLMAVAYFMAHQPKGAWPILNHGETAVLYAFIFLFLAANGPGGFSVDGLLKRGAAGSEVWTRHRNGRMEHAPHAPHRA